MAHQHRFTQPKRTASNLSHCPAAGRLRIKERRTSTATTSARRLRDSASRRHWLSSTAHVGVVFESTPMAREPT
jgi:hypothetical protein